MSLAVIIAYGSFGPNFPVVRRNSRDLVSSFTGLGIYTYIINPWLDKYSSFCMGYMEVHQGENAGEGVAVGIVPPLTEIAIGLDYFCMMYTRFYEIFSLYTILNINYITSD